MLNAPFELLRMKWQEIPAGNRRLKTPELLALPDERLRQVWEEAYRQDTADFAHRAWRYWLYGDTFRGRRVLDVGSGFGADGITFARAGARVTFLDIDESNLAVLRRLCQHERLANVDFFYMRDIASLAQLPADFDVMWCSGSLLTVPFEIARKESLALLEHLMPTGRWMELTYPKIRWEREGALPFETWGEKTDGGAPWIEWYDLEKLLARLAPERFEVILNLEFHNADFVWFDLLRCR